MKTILDVACVVGARPNFMKIAPILQELKQRPGFRGWLIHTGQHYSPAMSASFFQDLGLPQPDVSLGISGGTHTEQTAQIMLALEKTWQDRRPDLVLVVGDVNSTLAASLVAAKEGIPLAHVEAGLRSFDRTMPEEINRILTDSVSDYLFVSESSGCENLRKEGHPEERIFFTGNVMIDTLMRHREHAMQSGILDSLTLEPKSYAVVTMHRPANVDDPSTLERFLRMLGELATRIPIVFPVHPRTRNQIDTLKLSLPKVQLVEPLGYLDFLRLMSEARLVLTDSGGIQEETTILGVPCLTMRSNTERPVTVTEGTNKLVGIDPDEIYSAALEALERPLTGDATAPALWDGQAAKRIIDALEQKLLAV